MKNKPVIALAAIAFAAFAAYAVWQLTTPSAPTPPPQTQIALGEKIYNQNCLICHGKNGVGTRNWQSKTAAGVYPPPPLNGTAHTWHHSSKALRRQIKTGGTAMPAFGSILTDPEITAVINYLYSLWPPKVQKIWTEQVEGRD